MWRLDWILRSKTDQKIKKSTGIWCGTWAYDQCMNLEIKPVQIKFDSIAKLHYVTKHSFERIWRCTLMAWALCIVKEIYIHWQRCITIKYISFADLVGKHTIELNICKRIHLASLQAWCGLKLSISSSLRLDFRTLWHHLKMIYSVINSHQWRWFGWK